MEVLLKDLLLLHSTKKLVKKFVKTCWTFFLEFSRIICCKIEMSFQTKPIFQIYGDFETRVKTASKRTFEGHDVGRQSLSSAFKSTGSLLSGLGGVQNSAIRGRSVIYVLLKASCYLVLYAEIFKIVILFQVFHKNSQ